MKKLPLGIQSLREIITESCIYIDKTQYVYNLINGAKCYFLSRPRRFGKSLLLDTIAEAFSGDKELFKGLYIYDTDYEFEKHPVIRIDMSNMIRKTPDTLEKSLSKDLMKRVKRENLDIEYDAPSELFKDLIEELYDKYNQRVVVLIDEYDKPILDHITNAEKAESFREVLHEFYGILKSMDPYLRFVFITGVTKFTKTSIFSGLNNLRDITMTEKYSNICGIPTDELEKHFGEYIEALKTTDENKDCDNITDEILKWYDGYSWDGKTRVINPFALLFFLDEGSFENFWFSSGTPTFLMSLIKERPESFLELQDLEISTRVLDKYDIRRIEIEPLLFQSGYLTVAEKRYREGEASYLLKIPNREVSESFYLSIVSDFTENSDTYAESANRQIKESLETGDLQGMLDTLRGLFASIPYELHPYAQKNGQPQSDDPKKEKTQAEAYYHSIFYAILSLLGFDIVAEPSTSRGRVDAVLEHDDKVYVMEFKYAQCRHDAKQEDKQKLFEKTLDAAMEQITTKRYSDKFLGSGKTIYHVALAFIGRDDIEMRVQTR